MTVVKINPVKLGGEVQIPASKSEGHRSIICASLAQGKSTIKNISFSQDIDSTIEAMKNFGAQIERKGKELFVEGVEKLLLKNKIVHCGESGSTLRFLIPLGASLDKELTFVGRGKLVDRPLNVYYNIFKKQNILYKNCCGKLPLTINGRLKPGNYEVRGDISSQFITGLMYELPRLNGNSQINITTRLESKPYIDMTINTLKDFGINIENIEYKKFLIAGNQKYKNNDYILEGDFSQCAFILAMGVVGKQINCTNLKIESCQGDKVILDTLKKMGADISIYKDRVVARPSKTKGIIFDASQCPDLVPSVAALASVSKGTTEIINSGRLRIKESDRLKAISSQLNKIGGNVIEMKDGLIIKGKEELNGGEVDSFNDHRIAMALAEISSKCKNSLIINNAECVKKSYPDFWKDFKILGGDITIE